MAIRFIYFSFLLFLFSPLINSSPPNTYNICIKLLDETFDDNKQIDLTHYFNNQTTISTTITKGNNSLEFFFNPCEEVLISTPIGGDECKHGTSLCMRNDTNKKYTKIASTYSGHEFAIDIGIPILRFTYGFWTTSVYLICSPVKSVGNIYITSLEDKAIKMELVANAACLIDKPTTVAPTVTPVLHQTSGLSTGSVLCILFFVLLSIYFLGGACALRVIRGAQGSELVPNLEFWSQLPGLVRDGVTFLISGCRVLPAPYDAI